MFYFQKIELTKSCRCSRIFRNNLFLEQNYFFKLLKILKTKMFKMFKKLKC